VKTIIEEAVQAFEDRHNDRCLSINECDCMDLVIRANRYEESIESRIRSEVADLLEQEKRRWIPESDNRGALADWIESVFNNAINFTAAKR